MEKEKSGYTPLCEVNGTCFLRGMIDSQVEQERDSVRNTPYQEPKAFRDRVRRVLKDCEGCEKRGGIESFVRK